MKVKDVMTNNPVTCSPETPLMEVAQMMFNYDCGEIPVVENSEQKNLVGVITDRDIVCRTLGQGLDPTSMIVTECMSKPAVSISEDADLEECTTLMQDKQIRRIPVTDGNNAVCGIVSLADISKFSFEETSGEVLREVSRDIGAASNV